MEAAGAVKQIYISLAMSFNEEVQFDLMFYRSGLEPSLGGEKGIQICVRSISRTIRGLSECISIAWVNVLGGMSALIFDGETRVKGKEVDDWAMWSQMAMNHKAPRQKARSERHNAFIRGALQRAESHVIKESLCVSSTSVLGLVAFKHNALVPINDHTPYQALFGRQPH